MSFPTKQLETVHLCQPLDSGAVLHRPDRRAGRLLLLVHGRIKPFGDERFFDHASAKPM
jgi:hypothetical protein